MSTATVMAASSTIGDTAKLQPCHFRAAVEVCVVAFQAVPYIKNYTKFNFSLVIHAQGLHKDKNFNLKEKGIAS